MTKYEITLDQVNQLIVILAELPAKHSFNAISLLRDLPKLLDDEAVNDPES